MGKYLSPEYHRHMGSVEWQESKRHWRAASWRPKRCWVCRSRAVDGHHRSYRYFGKSREWRDLRALCRTHHQALERFQKRHHLRVESATRYYLVAAIAWRVLPYIALPMLGYFVVLGVIGSLR